MDHPPLLAGEDLPSYWCRVDQDGSYYLFLAQPKASEVVYPVYSGQSYMEVAEMKEAVLNINGQAIQLHLNFKPYQSLLLQISKEGQVDVLDISFVPKDPVIRSREEQRMYF